MVPLVMMLSIMMLSKMMLSKMMLSKMMLKSNMHILQMTAFTFLPAMCVAIMIKYWIGAFVYLVNFLMTIYSHRLIREDKYDYGDILDLCAIGAWVLYNFGIVIKTCMYILKSPHQSLQSLHGLSIMLTCMCAVICWRSNVKKNQFSFRSEHRNYYHGLMHCIGGLGSLILMMVINNITTSQ